MTEKYGRPLEILLVEDNPGDVRLMQETLKEGLPAKIIHLAEDGEGALRFLRGEKCYGHAVKPDIILLDLNLPGKSGLEILREIKEDEDLKHIPVIILTSSRADEDIMGAYRQHANCYIVKSFKISYFIEVVRAIERFWFSTVQLPAF